MRTNLGMMGITLVLPDFYHTQDPTIIKAWEIELDHRDLYYFRAINRPGSNTDSSIGLLYDKLLHAATDRQTAREIVRPKKRFSTTLVIGGEAVNGYLAAAQADNRNVESQKMLVVIRDADIDPDVSVDVRSFTQIPRIVRV